MNQTAALIQPEIVELVSDGAYGELREALRGVPSADVADIIASLEPEQAAVCFRFLPRDDAGEVFAYLDPELQEQLVLKLGDSALRVVEGMSADDRVRLLDELPPEVAQRLISNLPAEERKQTQAILGYPPGSVGRLMTPDYIRLRPEWTMGAALEHIRKYGRDAETINILYIVDDKGVLIDDVRLRALLLGDPQDTVESLMTRNFVALRADEPQEEAVRAMSRYDRVALPVTDSRGVLLGIVTVDDVQDVAEEEATEDIQKLGGMEALDEPYTTISMWRLARKRGSWLAVLFIGEMFTQTAMSGFEHEIERAAVLATFVPLIVSSGGNSGSQATSLIIRSLAIGEITLRDWWRVLRRELTAGLMLGAFLGLIGLLRVNIWGAMGWFAKHNPDGTVNTESLRAQGHYHMLAVAIAVSVVGVVLWGTIMGAMLPFILKKCRLDPATSSAPFVATCVDVVGVMIYFTTCVIVLRGTILV